MAKSAGMQPTVNLAATVRHRVCVIGLALVLACGSGTAMSADTPCSAGGAPQVPLALGVDGLVTGDGAPVILAGIAPFLPDADGPESWNGDLAAGARGEPFRLAPSALPDRYGRATGLVFDGEGTLLQATLIAEGRAIVRPDTVEEACAEALLALESAARSGGNGLWDNPGSIARAVDTASLLARSGLYGLVEGRIVSVGYGSRMVFLDFGRSFRTDFTVLVQGPLVSRLREAGFPVESLEGRTVRVRGIIEESGGPAIRLASPLALQLVDVME